MKTPEELDQIARRMYAHLCAEMSRRDAAYVGPDWERQADYVIERFIIMAEWHVANSAPQPRAGSALECGTRVPLSLSALHALEECPPLTKEQKAAFNKLTATDWTQEDWADLYNTMECVILRVCHRHGITNSVPRGTSRYPVLSAAEATAQSIKSQIPKL